MTDKEERAIVYMKLVRLAEGLPCIAEMYDRGMVTGEEVDAAIVKIGIIFGTLVREPEEDDILSSELIQ